MKKKIALWGIILLLLLTAGCKSDTGSSLQEKDMAKVGEMV